MILAIIILSVAVMAAAVIFFIAKLISLVNKSIKLVNDQTSIVKAVTDRQVNQAAEFATLLKHFQRVTNVFRKAKTEIADRLTAHEDMILSTVRSVRDLGESYNAFSLVTGQNFQEVWCDMCDDDCSICPFADQCEQVDNAMTQNPNMTVGEAYDNSIATADSGSLELDLSKPEDVNKLKDTLRSRGMSESEVLSITATMIERAKKNPTPKLTLMWETRMQKINPSHQCSEVHKSPVTGPSLPAEPKEEKIVDPKAKIVKTLENLYKKS